jgi:uncharacterized protein YlxW (UPF0749 family)
MCLLPFVLCCPLQAELADQRWQQQAKETQLKENPAWPSIDRLEQQQQQLQHQINTAREFIKVHEEKSNYKPLVPQLQELVNSINNATIGMLCGA